MRDVNYFLDVFLFFVLRLYFDPGARGSCEGKIVVPTPSSKINTLARGHQQRRLRSDVIGRRRGARVS